MQRKNQSPIGNPFNSLTSVIILVLFVLGLFYISRAIFWVLQWVAPVLLIITLIIDHKVVVNYGKWVINLFKTNVLWGLGATALTVLGFPVVSAFLLGKALLKRKIGQVEQKMTQQREGQYVEYEELESETLDLPQIEPIKEKRSNNNSGNDYEKLFE